MSAVADDGRFHQLRVVKELIFFCALVIRIAHQVDLRAFDRPVDQRVHAADGTQNAVELAAGHPEADEIDLLEFDPALLEPALGLFCVKAFFLSEDLDVHFIPPVTADNRRRLDWRLLKHGGSLRLGVGGKQKLARRGIDLYMTSDITHRNFHDAVPLSVDLRSV